MFRSLLLVLEHHCQPLRMLAQLEDILERLDPVVEILCVARQDGATGERMLQDVRERLEALDVRVSRATVQRGEVGEAVLRQAQASRDRPLVVMEGAPPRALYGGLPLPLLLLPKSDSEEPIRLREVVVAFAPGEAGPAAATLAGLCRGSGSNVVLLQEGVPTPALESARRRLESAGAAALVRRWAGEPRPDALQAEASGADLVALGVSRIGEPLVSSLLGDRPVLFLPGRVESTPVASQA